MMTFANPTNSGVANISSMIVPCMVNSWLYWSLETTTCSPGSHSSVRMPSASRPPNAKNANAMPMYIMPISL